MREAANPQGVLHAYEGLKNVLRHYGMLHGEITRIDTAPLRASAHGAGAGPQRLYPSAADGIWEPVVDPGRGCARRGPHRPAA